MALCRPPDFSFWTRVNGPTRFLRNEWSNAMWPDISATESMPTSPGATRRCRDPWAVCLHLEASMYWHIYPHVVLQTYIFWDDKCNCNILWHTWTLWVAVLFLVGSWYRLAEVGSFCGYMWQKWPLWLHLPIEKNKLHGFNHIYSKCITMKWQIYNIHIESYIYISCALMNKYIQISYHIISTFISTWGLTHNIKTIWHLKSHHGFNLPKRSIVVIFS